MISHLNENQLNELFSNDRVRIRHSLYRAMARICMILRRAPNQMMHRIDINNAFIRRYGYELHPKTLRKAIADLKRIYAVSFIRVTADLRNHYIKLT